MNTTDKQTQPIKSCWFWQHQWTTWKDQDELKLMSGFTDEWIGIGIQQERRCTKCNKVQLKISRCY